MAHTIDEVWQLCTDILTDLNDLHPMKTKLDTLDSKENLIIQCTFCFGLGTEERSVDHGQGRMGPDTEIVPCHRCGGDGVMKFATLSASTE